MMGCTHFHGPEDNCPACLDIQEAFEDGYREGVKTAREALERRLRSENAKLREALGIFFDTPVGEHHSVDSSGEVRLYVRVDVLETDYGKARAALFHFRDSFALLDRLASASPDGDDTLEGE